MRKLLIINIIFFTTFLSHAQNKQYLTSRDYPMSDNLDSLSKVAEATKEKPYEYLHSLIILERNRRYKQSPDFGKNFDTIFELASKQKSNLGLAQYYFLHGHQIFKQGKNSQAFNLYLKSSQNFEKINDTTGMVAINRALADLYSNTEPDLAKIYFNKAIMLAKKSSSPVDKIAYLGVIMFRNKLLDTLPNTKQIEAAFHKSIEIINKHPEFEMQRKVVYSLVQTGLSELQEYKLALKYALEALAYSKSKNFHHYINYFNVGNLMCKIGNYEEGIEFIKKSNELFIKSKANIWTDLYHHYNSLESAQYRLGKYKDAYETSLAKDSVRKIIDENYQKIALADIKTKYETEKKEDQIKNLALEKEVSDYRTSLIFGVLILVILGFLFVSYFAVKLRKSNAALRILQQERDKLYTIIAHDLRSPINTFQHLSELISQLLKTKQYNKVDIVLHQIEVIGVSLSSLLNNLLNWSVSLQREVQSKKNNINTKQFLEDMLPIYRKMAELKSINLKENLLDFSVDIDSNSLSVIVRNMLDNAIKYSNEGDNVEIVTEKIDNNLILHIANPIQNMTDTQLLKIKKLFDGTKKYTFGEDGLGIGMILAKQYADVCKANLSLQNDKSGTIIMSVEIPL